MKKSLYEIQKDYLEALMAIEDGEGEITEELETALAINQTELQNKAVNYAMFILEKEGDLAFVDSEMKRLSARKKMIQNLIDRLKSNIAAAMKMYEVEKIETPIVKLSFRKSERMEQSVLFDLNAIPSQFKKEVITIDIDKVSIKQALKDGFEIDGFELVQYKSLQIK
jgi:hypothetical protein